MTGHHAPHDDAARPSVGGHGPGRLFTLHMDFHATDERDARYQARAYAEALNTLCPEVDCHTIQISADQNWATAQSVLCGAPGPDPDDVCLDDTDHTGRHHGPGPTGTWAAAQLPAAPDTLSGLP